MNYKSPDINTFRHLTRYKNKYPTKGIDPSNSLSRRIIFLDQSFVVHAEAVTNGYHQEWEDGSCQAKPWPTRFQVMTFWGYSILITLVIGHVSYVGASPGEYRLSADWMWTQPMQAPTVWTIKQKWLSTDGFWTSGFPSHESPFIQFYMMFAR